MATNDVKDILRAVDAAGIKIIKFTGGEPLMRSDILEILKFAKKLNFDQIRLNTNGTLIDERVVSTLVKYVDDFLIPLESANPDTEERITGANVYHKKIHAIKMLRQAGAKIIRVGTVISKNLINNFEINEEIVEGLSIDAWGFFRPIIINKEQYTKQPAINDFEEFFEKLLEITKINPKKIYRMSNALPFCAFENPDIIAQLSFGALFDDGHTRFVIDPRGFAKPHYFIDENIGDAKKPLECWNHPFMVEMRNLQFMPAPCQQCLFKEKCRGGSRFAARIATGSYSGKDPLINQIKPVLAKKYD